MTSHPGAEARSDTGSDWCSLFDVQYEFDGTAAFGPTANQATPIEVADLFTALQEQLGLKLESRRATVDVLVVASAERPTDN